MIHSSFEEIVRCSANQAKRDHEHHPHIDIKTLEVFFESVHLLSLFKSDQIEYHDFVYLCQKHRLLGVRAVRHYDRLSYDQWPRYFIRETHRYSASDRGPHFYRKFSCIS